MVIVADDAAEGCTAVEGVDAAAAVGENSTGDPERRSILAG